MDSYSALRNVMAEMWVVPNLNSPSLGSNSNKYVGAEGMLGLSWNQREPGTSESSAEGLAAVVDRVPSSLSAALKQEIKPENEAELEVTRLLFLLLDSTELDRSHLEGIMYNSRI